MVGIVQQLGQASAPPPWSGPPPPSGAARGGQTANAETAASYADRSASRLRSRRPAESRQRGLPPCSRPCSNCTPAPKFATRLSPKLQADRQAAAATQGNSAATAANNSAAQPARRRHRQSGESEMRARRIASPSDPKTRGKPPDSSGSPKPISRLTTPWSRRPASKTNWPALKPNCAIRPSAKSHRRTERPGRLKALRSGTRNPTAGPRDGYHAVRADALALFAAKQAETILRERNTGWKPKPPRSSNITPPPQQLLDDVKQR